MIILDTDIISILDEQSGEEIKKAACEDYDHAESVTPQHKFKEYFRRWTALAVLPHFWIREDRAHEH